MQSVFLWLVATLPLYAAEDVVLRGSVANVEADAWTVSGVDWTITLADPGIRGQFRIDRILLQGSGQVFDDTRIACGRIELTTHAVRCANGNFAAVLPGLGRRTFAGEFLYDYVADRVSVGFSSLEAAGGMVEGQVAAGDAGIEVRFSAAGTQLAGLLEIAGEYSDAVAGFSAGGTAELSGAVSLPPEGPAQARMTATLTDAAIANDAGTVATDGIGGKLALDVTFAEDGLRFDFGLDSDRGEAYVEPVYANFAEHALSLKARGVASAAFDVFDVSSFEIRQPDLVDAAGTASLRLPAEDDAAPSISASVKLRDTSVTHVYENLVRIALAGTIFGDLETDGRLSGSIAVADNVPRSAKLELDDVILDDARGRFSVYGLRGCVDWHSDQTEPTSPSTLRWDSGTVYSLLIGGGELPLQLGGFGMEFLAPLRVPTMGGALLIREFAVQDFGTAAATGRFDAELEPIQLGQLTAAFGWPAFSGTLSGRLPRLQLADNAITVSGALSAQAFDGRIELSNLRIEQPFGRVPRLRTDVVLRELDLQRITEVFSFGLIQGRLSGEVTGLRMENWRPVAMDMHFYTPRGDRSPHRISQRAVENLASVGGSGAAGVLSTGFLQFFEVFAYDRIGLRCVLANGVCAMSGVEPAKAGPSGIGYYIVKGSGIPRIDVVGYRESVSWSRLMQQLAAITRGGSPTVN
ncbi:MAG: hypothetical protein R3315_09910 [Woeseiaceae bacterium]|nr:hypothetical protein [Woeseiaceae bacterium]